jgi:hypothetical protein
MLSNPLWKKSIIKSSMVIKYLGKKKWVFLGFFMETQKPKKKNAKIMKKNLCSGVSDFFKNIFLH